MCRAVCCTSFYFHALIWSGCAGWMLHTKYLREIWCHLITRWCFDPRLPWSTSSSRWAARCGPSISTVSQLLSSSSGKTFTGKCTSETLETKTKKISQVVQKQKKNSFMHQFPLIRLMKVTLQEERLRYVMNDQLVTTNWSAVASGDLYFEKAVNGFLSDLFTKWKVRVPPFSLLRHIAS